MNIKNITCKVCGSQYIKKTGIGQYVCEACDNKFLLNDELSDKARSILTMADNFLMNKDFHKAKQLYTQAIETDSDAIEAYWGAICSTYGIEYVKEKDENGNDRYIPTLHRCSFETIYEDTYVIKLLQLLEGNDLKKAYEDKLAQIEQIRTKINDLARKEKPYDIFICFKATREVGGQTVPTEDSKIANDIYHDLSAKNYKVFFSEKTLNNVAGSDYEPIIFNALESSWLMLFICTDKEYANATWVKNEWSRFLDITHKQKNKKLIPVIKSSNAMTIKDLPEEFLAENIQALDTASYNFKDNLLESIQNIQKNYVLTSNAGGIQRKVLKQQLQNFKTDIKLQTKTIEKRSFNNDAKSFELPKTFDRSYQMATAPHQAGKFAKAQQIYLNLLAQYPNQYLCLKGCMYSETESITDDDFVRNAYKLKSFDKLDAYLSNAPKEEATKMIDSLFLSIDKYMNRFKQNIESFFNLLVQFIDKKETSRFIKILSKSANKYQTGLVDKSYSKDTIFAEKLLRLALSLYSENEANKYCDNLFVFAEKYKGISQFALARKFYDEILAINPAHTFAILDCFLCDNGVADFKDIPNLRKTIYKQTFVKELETLIEKGVDTADLIYNSTKLLTEDAFTSGKKADKVFEQLATIMPNVVSESQCSKYYFDFANMLLLAGQFSLADKYYNQCLSINNNDTRAFWGKVKTTYKCKSDYELLLLPNKEDASGWTTSTEFSNVIASCENDIESGKYLDFQKKYENLDKQAKIIIKQNIQKFDKEGIVTNIATNAGESFDNIEEAKKERKTRLSSSEHKNAIKVIIIHSLSMLYCLTVVVLSKLIPSVWASIFSPNFFSGLLVYGLPVIVVGISLMLVLKTKDDSKNTIITFVLAAILALGSIGIYFTGSWIKLDNISVSTKEELISALKTATFYHDESLEIEITNDIDFGGDTIDFKNNQSFYGTLDGKNHKITNYGYKEYKLNDSFLNLVNMVYVYPDYYQSFIAINKGTICNLTIQCDIEVETVRTHETMVGGIVAVNIGTIDNCHFTGKISSKTADCGYRTYIGGISGFEMETIRMFEDTTEFSTVQNCSTDLNIAFWPKYCTIGGITAFSTSRLNNLINCTSNYLQKVGGYEEKAH